MQLLISDPAAAFVAPQIGGKTPEEAAFLKRLVAVQPSARQLSHSRLPYYSFIHFGMNTMTGREWGLGDEDLSLFHPDALDTDGWCRVLKESGSRGVILTAKHHDGFCLWDTKTTTHSVMHTPYGKDILAQLRQSCDKYGLRLGVYLSPWDRNAKQYGTERYNDFFVAQLTELCSGYGELFEVWFDGACGEGKNGKKQRYDWQRYYRVIRKLLPDAVIAVSGPDVRWIGNEGGKVRESEWSVVGAPAILTEKVAAQSQTDETDLSFDRCEDDLGSRDALKGETDLIWSPAEADVSVTTGWFYHDWKYYLFRKKRTAKQLADIYFNTVGGNATLLLNVPPDNHGRISRREQRTLRRFTARTQAPFRHPLDASYALLKADGTVLDGDEVQALKDGARVAFPTGAFVLQLTFDGAKTVRTLSLKEDIACSQRVERFSVWAYTDKGKLQRLESCTVIGRQKIVRLKQPVKAQAIFVVIEQSRAEPVLMEAKAFG